VTNMSVSMTTMILIVTAIATLIFVLGVNIQIISLQINSNEKIWERTEYLSIREKLTYCYGAVINPNQLVSNIECLGLDENQKISVKRIKYGRCSFGHIIELNYRSNSHTEVFPVPIYDEEQDIVCPAVLSVYKNADEVTLISNLVVGRRTLVQGEQTDINVSFYQTISPSEITIHMVNSSGNNAYSYTSQGVGVGLKEIPFVVDTITMQPGLYTITTEAKSKEGYTDIIRNITTIRVVDITHKPEVKWSYINPITGTLQDSFDITLNITGYLDISTVDVIITNQTDNVDVLALYQTAKTKDEYFLINEHTYYIKWIPTGLPNSNVTYRLFANLTNEIGNTAIEQLHNISIIENILKFRLVVVPINYNFPSLRSQYESDANDFFNFWIAQSPIKECSDPSKHAELLLLKNDCSIAKTTCYGVTALRPNMCSCGRDIIKCAEDEFGADFEKAEGIFHGSADNFVWGGKVTGCAGLSNLGVPPHLGSLHGGAVHETAVGFKNGHSSTHELGHDFGLCHTMNLARPALCPNSETGSNLIMNYGPMSYFGTQAYSHLKTHPYLIDYLEGCP
jgi:hypothetical protein